MIYCSVCGRPTSDQGPEACASCEAVASTAETVEVEVTIPEPEGDSATVEIQGVPVTVEKDASGYWKVVHLGPES